MYLLEKGKGTGKSTLAETFTISTIRDRLMGISLFNDSPSVEWRDCNTYHAVNSNVLTCEVIELHTIRGEGSGEFDDFVQKFSIARTTYINALDSGLYLHNELGALIVSNVCNSRFAPTLVGDLVYDDFIMTGSFVANIKKFSVDAGYVQASVMGVTDGGLKQALREVDGKIDMYTINSFMLISTYAEELTWDAYPYVCLEGHATNPKSYTYGTTKEEESSAPLTLEFLQTIFDNEHFEVCENLLQEVNQFLDDPSKNVSKDPADKEFLRCSRLIYPNEKSLFNALLRDKRFGERFLKAICSTKSLRALYSDIVDRLTIYYGINSAFGNQTICKLKANCSELPYMSVQGQMVICSKDPALLAAVIDDAYVDSLTSLMYSFSTKGGLLPGGLPTILVSDGMSRRTYNQSMIVFAPFGESNPFSKLNYEALTAGDVVLNGRHSSEVVDKPFEFPIVASSRKSRRDIGHVLFDRQQDENENVIYDIAVLPSLDTPTQRNTYYSSQHSSGKVTALITRKKREGDTWTVQRYLSSVEYRRELCYDSNFRFIEKIILKEE